MCICRGDIPRVSSFGSGAAKYLNALKVGARAVNILLRPPHSDDHSNFDSLSLHFPSGPQRFDANSLACVCEMAASR